MKKIKYTHTIWIILLSLISIIMMIPILMMISTSLKSTSEIRSATFHFIPKVFQWSNYVDAMKTGTWGIYFKNSLIITISAVLFSLLFNSIAGFAFARLEFRGSKILFLLVLVGLMMPPQVTMLPTFLIMVNFPLVGGNNILGIGGSGLVNTLTGVIVPLMAGSFGVFLCKQFYESFPKSLDEAATIDGANKWQLYFLIYVPNSIVIFTTLTLLKGLSVWNDYLWPLVMTSSESKRTIQLALSMFTSQDITNWSLLMAASTIISIPMIILFLFTQKYFVRGILTTGIK